MMHASLRRLRLLMPVLVVLAVSAPLTFARAATPADSEEALLDEGFKLRQQGNDQGALASFLQAYELSHGARALAQVALAEQALGRWASAEAHLTEAIGSAGEPWIIKNKPALQGALRDIQEHVGTLELVGGTPGAEVLIDGARTGVLPLAAPLHVAAGSVALEVRAPGYLPVLRSVIIRAHALTRETVALVPSAVAPPPVTSGATPATVVVNPPAPASPPPAASSAWGTGKTVGLVLGVAGVAAAGFGATYLVIQHHRAQDFKDGGCTTADPVQSPACQSLKDKADTASILGITGFVGAALLVGTGTFLFLNSGPRASETTKVATSALSDLRCAPAGSVVSCAGRF